MGQLRNQRHIHPQGLQLLHLGKDFLRRTVQYQLPLIHQDNAVRIYRLFHIVGNQDDGDALLLVQLPNGTNHLRSTAGIQHGGGLIQYNGFRLHSQRSCNGYPLLLSAG